jgi:hypothetical protein
MPDKRQMDPDLMRAPGFDIDFQKRMLQEALKNPKVRYRGLTRAQDRHSLPVFGVAPDRGVNRRFILRNLPIDQCQVRFLDRLVTPLSDQ